MIQKRKLCMLSQKDMVVSQCYVMQMVHQNYTKENNYEYTHIRH